MATYQGTTINDLVVTTPLEGATTAPDINDAIREIKNCVKTSFGVSHNTTTGLHNEFFFFRTGTLTSATGNATPLSLITDAEVPAGKSVYVAGWIAHVNGATAWSHHIFIEDTSNVGFAKLDSSSLGANKIITNSKPDADVDEAHLHTGYNYANGLGGTAAKGLQARVSATGATGSDCVITVYGMIK